MSDGGKVEPYCSQDHKHLPGCQYAEGGVVSPPKAFLEIKDDPADVLGHAAVEHGLLGIINNSGNPKMIDPGQHTKVLQEAKAQYAWRAQPKEMMLPKTHGHKLGNHIADQNHDEMASHMHGHPLVGGAGKTHLKPIMAVMAKPIIEGEPHPEAMRGSVDYLSTAIRGHERLDSYMKKVIGNEKLPKLHVDVKELKSKVDALNANPESLLDVGGSLNHYLPAHGVQVAATSASAVNYLKSLKPTRSQNAPLDKPSPADPVKESAYNRQLAIAQQPLLAMQHLKDGTLLPPDLATINTIYPALLQSMKSKATSAMIDAQSRGDQIPYHQRLGLSMLLGQPLDSTMTPDAMQSIIKSAGPQQAQQQMDKAAPKKASGVELKQINKVDELALTSLQKRQIDKK